MVTSAGSSAAPGCIVEGELGSAEGGGCVGWSGADGGDAAGAGGGGGEGGLLGASSVLMERRRKGKG